MIGSGNRDPDAWDADRFRPERFTDGSRLPNHLGFGLGAHFCVGAALARMSASHGLMALLDATTDRQLEPGWGYDKVPYHAIQRPRTLSVRLTASRNGRR